MKTGFLFAALLFLASSAHAMEFTTCAAKDWKIVFTINPPSSLHAKSPSADEDVVVKGPIVNVTQSDLTTVTAQSAVDTSKVDLSKSYKAEIEGKTQYFLTLQNGGQFLVADAMAVSAPCP